MFTPDQPHPNVLVVITPYRSVSTNHMAHLLGGLVGAAELVLEGDTGSGYEATVFSEQYERAASIEVHPVVYALLCGEAT